MKPLKTFGAAAAVLVALGLSACGRDDVPEPTTAPADTMDAPMTEPGLGTPGTTPDATAPGTGSTLDPSLSNNPGMTGTTPAPDASPGAEPSTTAVPPPGSPESTAPAGGAGSPDGSVNPGSPSSSVSGKTRFA